MHGWYSFDYVNLYIYLNKAVRLRQSHNSVVSLIKAITLVILKSLWAVRLRNIWHIKFKITAISYKKAI